MKPVNLAALVTVCGLIGGQAIAADDLFGRAPGFSGLASDVKAAYPGDALTVVIFQNAEARGATGNRAQRRSIYDKEFGYDGGLDPNPVRESFSFGFGGRFAGDGEVRRSESVFAQISVSVIDILPNGDLLVEGEQSLRINGEVTRIGVRGQVRHVDITPENRVLSTNIVNAEINYNGQGFVSDSTEPGILNWLFSLFGLG